MTRTVRWATADASHLVVAGFVVVRLLEAGVGSGPVTLPDSPMYLPPSDGPRFAQVDYLGHAPRPWVVTLPYAVIPSERWIVALQIAVSILSWSALLVAVGHLRLRNTKLRLAALLVVGAIGLSSTATFWNIFLQSDSLAMSGGVLITAAATAFVGRRRSWWAVAGLAAGALLVCQIRPVALLTVVVLVAWLGLSVVTRGRVAAATPLGLRPDRRHGTWVPLAGAVVLVLVAGYSVVLNANMDRAWGADFAGDPRLQGRTMQQIGVIALTPWGRGLVIRLAEQGGFDCMAEQYRTNTDPNGWRGQLVTTCPEEAQRFSHDFQGRYVRWLASHPRAAVRVLLAPFNEAFTTSSAETELDVIPGPISELWQPSSPTGRNPTMLWLLLLAAATVLMLTTGWRDGGAALLMLGLGVAGAMAVVVTVAFSPLDAARVGSAPAMLTRLPAVIGLLLSVDPFLSRPTPQPHLEPARS